MHWIYTSGQSLLRYQQLLLTGLRYDSGFGSPVARALGSGYVLELLSRLTQTPIHKGSSSSPVALINNPSTFSVNLTLDLNPVTFPLDQPLYVDATHEVVIVNILTALNLTILAKEGQPSGTKMNRGRTWFSSRIAPFASNMQLQCELPFYLVDKKLY